MISCTSTGSRPKASIYWLLGDGKTNITAYATQLPPSHDTTTDTYSVTSTLTYSMDRIYNGKYMFCGARNEATLEQEGGVETSKTLNITCKLRVKFMFMRNRIHFVHRNRWQLLDNLFLVCV